MGAVDMKKLSNVYWMASKRGWLILQLPDPQYGAATLTLLIANNPYCY